MSFRNKHKQATLIYFFFFWMCFNVVRYNEKWYKINYNDIFSQNITFLYLSTCARCTGNWDITFQLTDYEKKFSKSGCNLEFFFFIKIVKLWLIIFWWLTWWFIFIWIDILSIMSDCFIRVDIIQYSLLHFVFTWSNCSEHPSDISSTVMYRY